VIDVLYAIADNDRTATSDRRPRMFYQRWDGDGEPTEAKLRAELEEMGYEVVRYSYPPGTHFPAHTHDVDKIDAVVSGRFEIVLEGDAVVLEAGDWIEVPRGAVHSARVVGAETVVSLDAVRVEDS
jgi:quercetin dioxygenase-like cupin family protein